ncbi:MAG: NAD(+)/NADH kinase [Alphaproteobacteria bacterium]|nr:NAD(+)/NADH kinase [Alphaproteobacteria bacterium]
MKIFFCADERNNEANQKLRACIKRYGQADLDKADVVVALGGDGFVLKVLRGLLNNKIPVFGLNFGHVGYLLNHYRPEGLPERIAAAKTMHLTPLVVRAESFDGKMIQEHVFNDVSLTRQSPQAARLTTLITDEKNNEPLIMEQTVFGDGLIVATPIGSSGYYTSAGGQPFPAQTGLIGVKGTNCRESYNPIVSDKAHIFVQPQEPVKRPIQLDCDGKKRFKNIATALIQAATGKTQTLLVER